MAVSYTSHVARTENVVATEGWSCFVFTNPSLVQSENVHKALDYKEQIMPSYFCFLGINSLCGWYSD
jgi:hypothetical protein